MAVRFTLSNPNEFFRDMDMTAGIFAKVTSGRILTHAAEFLVGKMIPRTPVKWGHLRDSYHVGDVQFSLTKASIVIENTADYALWVHELVNLVHRQGQAKFMEVPLLLYGREAIRKAAEG